MLNPGSKVYRATVVNSSKITGDIYVQIGAFGTTNNTVAISTIGRFPVNGMWKVPDPGDQVYISADDDSMSNPVLLDTLSSDELSTGDPMGHENKALSVVSFNDASRTFTIAPLGVAHYVWCKSKRFTKTSAESVQLPNAVSQLYFIYYDTQGVLKFRAGPQVNWGEEVPVSYVYWNSANARHEFFADERHGITMDWQTHEYLHRTRGAALASGFAAYNFTTSTVGTSATNADAQIGLFGGTFFDEDLQVDVTHSATPAAFSWQQRLEGIAYIPIYFLNPQGWTRDTATTFPLKQGTALPKYNLNTSGTFSTPDLSSNKYGITWVIATNGLGVPVIGILGQGEYNNIGEAEAAKWGDLTLSGFPVVELRPLYKVVYQVGNSFTSTPKAAIRGVYDIRTEVSSVTSTSLQTTDHGLLTGLADDDHPQYLRRDYGAMDGIIEWTNTAVAPPSTTALSIGSRIVFKASTAPGDTDVALGIDTNTLWSSVTSSASSFRWYAAGTNVGTLSGTGNLTVTGAVAATTFSGTGASLTGIPNSATTATSANTPNAIVARDGSGNFSVNAITLTGASASVVFPNTTNAGIQNTAGTSYFHLDRSSGNSQWKVKTGASALIDADTISLRGSGGGTTFSTVASTGASVINSLSLTVAGSGTSSLVNNAGSLEVRGGTNVVLSPSASGRIATGRGKNTLQMTGFTNLVPTTDVTLSNSATDMINGISVTSMEAGDVLDIRAVLRMQRTTSTTSSLTIVVNVAGPGGNTNLPGRLIYADGTVTTDIDHTHTGQWLYTCALGAGTYTVKVFGFGFAASVWKMLAVDSDSVLSVATYSMR